MNKPFKINDQNEVQFLTFTVIDWIDVFTRKDYKIDIVDSLNFCIKNKGLEVYGWCLMSNHLHLICRAAEPGKLSDIIRDFKRFTARIILKSLQDESIESRRKWILNQMKFRGNILQRVEEYKFWKDGYHGISITSSKFLEQKLDYIHQNPVRALIVEEAEHYIYSSARDYAGKKGLVDVLLY
ncbi:REP-associated tyrosine transposase [Mongoliibacter ruber]|uniref:REP element-mobilizing transposase RayT n=1 Tax=Mongoliibacter ruber TaxID=1750599 RepID=A0A2T0WQM4_9BACT|nr:transposase [Mongoliibacter ruber]PRY88996.1 REP element-mobilizing transposase RayT [Mongoliibacter ruber]